MKMRSRSAYDPLGLRAGRRPASLGASSPLKSLAWTSLRTPNCRLASARARGADCFTLSMSSGAGVEETIMENIFPCCAGLDVHKESVEACVRRIEPNGRWHQQTRHWGTMGPFGDGRLDGRARRHAGGDGIDRRVLETDLQHPGEPLHDAAGECAAPEASTGAEERCTGLPVDRTTVAVRVAERQLHSATLPARIARSDPTPNAVGGGKDTHREPDSQGFAGYQHQAIVGGDGCSGRLRPGDAGSLDHGGRGSGEARPFGTAEAAEQDPRVGEGPGRTPDRASSVHAAVAVETTGPAGRADRRVRPQNRGANAPFRG